MPFSPEAEEAEAWDADTDAPFCVDVVSEVVPSSEPEAAVPDASAPDSPVEVVVGALPLVAVVSAPLPTPAVVVAASLVLILAGLLDGATSKLDTIPETPLVVVALVVASLSTVVLAAALTLITSFVVGFCTVVSAGS